MRTAIQAAFLALMLIPEILPQNQIKINPVGGIFIYNSENSLPVLGKDNYIFNYGFEIGYINRNFFSYHIQFDYSYIYSGVDETLETAVTMDSPEPLGYAYTDVSLSFHNLDLSMKHELNELFVFGAGPSFAIVNRSVCFGGDYFEDRLASFNIGLHGIIDTQIPFSSDSPNFYFYCGVKLRYLYGLFYDRKGRDLSEYNQHFLMLNLLAGITFDIHP